MSLMDLFNFSIFGAALLLSVLGLWFIAIIPGLDRWSKRFFLYYFIAFMLCCLSTMLELIPLVVPISTGVFRFFLVIESLLLSLPLPMLTLYLLHWRGESWSKSWLLRAVAGLWAIYCLLVLLSPFIGVFIIVTPDNQYDRGPLYPLALLPVVLILLLNLSVTLQSRKLLSPKVRIGFLVAILPILLALILQLFWEVFPLVDIGYVVSALTMYGFVLSDQIEKDLRREREITRQQQELAQHQASLLVLQMRPHYIYNTLMSIYSLINQDPQKARQVTADFTDYLRKNFNAVASDRTIPFSAELEHTRAYLAVEQSQYEELLVVDYDTPFTQFRLPPLTLQPLAENAVKHGIDPYAGPLYVTIRTRLTDAATEITVEDTGPGFDPNDGSKPHPTLDNLRQRLEMMCGGTLEIAARETGGTRVTIRIPMKKPGDPRNLL